MRPPGLLVILAGLTACLGADASVDRAGGGERAGGRAAASPEAVRVIPLGMDSALLAGALEEAASLPRLRSLIVARHGEVWAGQSFRGPGLDAPRPAKRAPSTRSGGRRFRAPEMHQSPASLTRAGLLKWSRRESNPSPPGGLEPTYRIPGKQLEHQEMTGL
jgi:hypothetical protein